MNKIILRTKLFDKKKIVILHFLARLSVDDVWSILAVLSSRHLAMPHLTTQGTTEGGDIKTEYGM